MDKQKDAKVTKSEPRAPEKTRRLARFGRALGQVFWVDSWLLTAVYWVSVFGLALAIITAVYVPMVDYIQHEAVGSILHDLWRGTEHARSLYRPTLFTYNAGFEVLVALGSWVMSPHMAGRLVIAVQIVLSGVAMLALLRAAGRPRWYALLAVPVLFHMMLAWGFVNFTFALPLALLTFVHWLAVAKGDWRAWRVVTVVLLSLAVAYTHVLVMLCFCAMVAVSVFSRSCNKGRWRGLRHWLRWFAHKDLWLSGLLLVPAVGYSLAAWFYARATFTKPWENSHLDGRDAPLWRKLWDLPQTLVGMFTDKSDTGLLLAAAGLALVLVVSGRRSRWHPMMKHLAVVFLACYMVFPMMFMSTAFINPRFLPIAWFFGVAALPCVSRRMSRYCAPLAAVIALGAVGNVMWRIRTLPDARDAVAIIGDAPANKSMIGVNLSTRAQGWSLGVYVHLAALYQGSKQGVVAYSFMRHESPPVHYLPGKEPPYAPQDFEWAGKVYRFTANYARHYDLVLATVQTSETADPGRQLFGRHYAKVVKVSKRGRFWLYDATKYNQEVGK